MSSIVENLSEKAFDNFKNITPALTAIALLTGMILFLPDRILSAMNLDEMPSLWNQMVGIVFLLSVALIATIIVFSAIKNASERRKNKRIRDNLKKKLATLSPRQKDIIVALLQSEDKTISLDKNSGDTIYLVNNLFLYMPEQIFSVGWDDKMILNYVPQSWLLDLYNEEPDLFK